MPRILYLTGGYTTHDRRFLAKLATTGHEVWYQPVGDDGARFESRPLPDGIRGLPPLVAGPATAEPERIRAALRVLRERAAGRRYDLFHAGPVHVGGLLAALADLRPRVVMSWGSDVLQRPQRDSLHRWAAGLALASADAVVGDCEAVRVRVRELTSVPDGRIVTFPWGVDLKHCHPEAPPAFSRERLGWAGRRVLIHTRGFEPHYQPRVVLEAFRAVASARGDVALLLLGAGSLRAEAEAYVRDEGLAESVHFAGQVGTDEMPRWCAAADLYVSASVCDGSSIGLLEALACGKPAIVPDVGGNPEWVLPGRTGWLFPIGESAALASALLAALDCREIDRYAQAAVELARRAADWDENFPKLLDAYEIAGGAAWRRAKSTSGRDASRPTRRPTSSPTSRPITTAR